MDTIKRLQKECKTAHILLVDGMSKLITHEVRKCQSSVFHAFGLKWDLIILPAGKDGLDDNISFYLRIKDRGSLPSNWLVQCDFRLGVVSQTQLDKSKFSEFDVDLTKEKVSHGKRRFMSHRHLNASGKGYIVNDQVIFCAEITAVRMNDVTVLGRAMGTAERLKLNEVPRDKSKFTWKITQFSSFNGESHSSYEFSVGPRRWKLEMLPKGHKDGKGNSLSLFLHATDYVTDGPKAKTLAVCKLRVLDQLHGDHFETKMSDWFDSSEGDCAWGVNKFLPLEKLMEPSWGYLLKDQIYIGIEFLLVSTTEYL